MQKVLHINPEKCNGCLQCEMACSFENYGVFAPAKSRIKVFDFHETGKKVPYTCTQCDEAWCLHACPVEAITLDNLTGAKVVNDSTCVGCKVCTIACPFGTVNYVQDTGKVRPDVSWFPDYDQQLADAMTHETELFFGDAVKNDRSLFDLFTADYTFANERLARHYGIPNVSGNNFRKVSYPDSTRRGLLGHGGRRGRLHGAVDRRVRDAGVVCRC